MTLTVRRYYSRSIQENAYCILTQFYDSEKEYYYDRGILNHDKYNTWLLLSAVKNAYQKLIVIPLHHWVITCEENNLDNAVVYCQKIGDFLFDDLGHQALIWIVNENSTRVIHIAFYNISFKSGKCFNDNNKGILEIKKYLELILGHSIYLGVENLF